MPTRTPEPDDDGRLRPVPRGRRRRGELAAGRVLGIVVAALALAALVNADSLVERAERKPLGPGRDRSLAIWHPVQDVAHVLQLHRLRDLAEALTGDDADEHRAASVTPTTEPAAPDGRATTTTTEPPRRPRLRMPTATAPLRVWAGGDSMMRDLSESILRLAADDPLLDVTTHYEISSGLTRPDYYDWPRALAADLAETGAEVVMVLFGANDAQGIVAPDGTVHQRVSEPGWQAEYARRVEAVMDLLRGEDDDRLVLWVLLPPMRDGGFDGRMQILNDIYREAARGRPWIDVIETAPLFGGTEGRFIADLRQDDGIHLSRSGADLLAGVLLDRVEAELGPAATTTTSGRATTSTTG